MRRYGEITAEGFMLVAVPILYALFGVLLIAAIPFTLLGLLKRGVVAAITGGDPLVP